MSLQASKTYKQPTQLVKSLVVGNNTASTVLVNIVNSAPPDPYEVSLTSEFGKVIKVTFGNRTDFASGANGNVGVSSQPGFSIGRSIYDLQRDDGGGFVTVYTTEFVFSSDTAVNSHSMNCPIPSMVYWDTDIVFGGTYTYRGRFAVGLAGNNNSISASQLLAEEFS